jgi:amidohydrolase
MTLDRGVLERCVRLRHELHRIPERSNDESRTAERLCSELSRLGPDWLITGIGGYGILVGFDGPGSGPNVLLRCEMDALPVQETVNLPHASQSPGVSHKCGHDGHMATAVAVASHVAYQRPSIGRISVLFQPAEETGEGAARALAEPAIRESPPDYVLALHNLPGFPKGDVVVRDDLFAFGSIGAEVRFHGAESHAAEPERGRSPAAAVAETIQALGALTCIGSALRGAGVVTIVHVRVGEPTFGTSPGHGQILATFRAPTRRGLQEFQEATLLLVDEIAATYKLCPELAWREEFPPTLCDPGVVSLIEACARELELTVTRLEEPFPWSEDFGHFTRSIPGALFGLGAGTGHAPLHHPAYDFPDDLIGIGAELMLRVIRTITSKWRRTDESYGVPRAPGAMP